MLLLLACSAMPGLHAQRVDHDVGHGHLLPELRCGERAAFRIGHELFPQVVGPGGGFLELVRGGAVLGVELPGRLEHGDVCRLAVGRELLEQLQRLADLEHRDVDVRAILELEEMQRGLAR